MKNQNRALFLKLIFICLLSTLVFANTPIANYQMDECSWNGTQNEVKDSSGNDLNGTAIDGAETQSSNIAKGGICHTGLFNGEGYVEIKDNVLLNPSGAFSVSVWFKADKIDTWDGVVSKLTDVNGGKGRGWNIQVGSAQRIASLMDDSSGAATYLKSTTVPKEGVWYHVVFVHHDDNINDLYVDGVKEASNTHAIAFTNNDLQIGTFYTNSSSLRFKGNIDEFKIFNSELNSTQVREIYNNEKDKKNWDGSERVCSCADPIADYQMDECSWNGTSSEVKDSSGNNFNGTAINGANTESNSTAGGVLCRTGDFNTTQKQHIKINNFEKIKGSRTITAWIKSKSYTGGRIFADDKNDNAGDYALSYRDTGSSIVRFYIRGLKPVSLDSSAIIDVGKWYFLVAKFDANSMEKYLYIYDSSGHKIDDVNQSVEGTLRFSEGHASIGGELSNAKEANRMQFNGYIDEVKIFDRALDNNQIQSIYNNEKDGKNYDGKLRECMCSPMVPIVNYQMDECSWNGTPNEVKDSSGNNLNGTAIDGATTQSSVKAGGGLCHVGNFNGSDYAEVLNNALLNPTGAFSTSVWFKENSITTWQGVVSKLTNVNSHTGRGWNIQVGSAQKISSLMADSNGNYVYLKSNTTPQVNLWYHVVLVHHIDNKNDLYVNGIKEASNTHAIAFTSNNLEIGRFYTDLGGLMFDGQIDEFKIFNSALNPAQVSMIYNNEKDKKNWDGSERVCSCNLAYKFDALDIFRDINDRNISTKIVNQPFNLTIVSLDKNNTKLQDFNGTVCASVDNNTTKLDFRDQNSSVVTFKIQKAMRDVRVHISWKKDADESCPLVVDDNETNSTDNFAIRPKAFDISNYPNTIYAGEDFNISFEALDNSGANTTDYNESNGTSFDINVSEIKNGCFSGTYSGDVSFSDGGNTTVANYDEVGEINITTAEINGSEFAKVDEDDTNDSDRLIKEKNITIKIKPYDLNLTYDISNINWTYMDSNLSHAQTYIKLNAMISAYAKGKTTTLQDFNSTCYAKDINISFLDTNITHNDKFNGTYYDVIKDKNLTDNNFANLTKDYNWTIDKSDFINGEGNLSIRFNVGRNYSKAIPPVDVHFRDINITTPNLSKNENNTSMDNNITFYYGRVKTKDIDTNKHSVHHTLDVEVYSTSNLPLFRQNSLSWYSMKDDNITKIINFLPKKDFMMNSGAKTGISDINSTQNILNGIVDFTITNSWTSPDSAYIHLKIPKYLWYSRYNGYDDNSSSDCGSHPCFKYNYLQKIGSSNIQSGDFNGTNIGSEYNASKVSKRGVKVFR